MQPQADMATEGGGKLKNKRQMEHGKPYDRRKVWFFCRPCLSRFPPCHTRQSSCSWIALARCARPETLFTRLARGIMWGPSWPSENHVYKHVKCDSPSENFHLNVFYAGFPRSWKIIGKWKNKSRPGSRELPRSHGKWKFGGENVIEKSWNFRFL